MRRHFTKEGKIFHGGKHMLRHSTSLAVKKVKMKDSELPIHRPPWLE